MMQQAIILDTNIISEQLRAEPSEKVLRWLNQQPTEVLFLSTITVAELRAGVALMPQGKRQRLLQTSVENSLLPFFAVATRDEHPFVAAGLNVINPWNLAT